MTERMNDVYYIYLFSLYYVKFYKKFFYIEILQNNQLGRRMGDIDCAIIC